MSRATSRRNGLSPSLFPFLAVMLCTIGALILILIISVSNSQSAVNEIVSRAEEQVELEEETIALVSRGLSEKYSEGKILLEKKRLSLQHLEKHIRDLLDELDDLQRQNELAETARDRSEDAEGQKDELVAALEKQLAQAKEELEQKMDDPDGDKPIFAIIPYEGPNGTHRRPIYLECNGKGVVIQPEGVLITPADLAPPYGPGNPLDAALRTIRAEFPSTTGSVTSNPYPLLVVRPSGIRHYMMARAAMTGWDDQFGYELVREDMELAFPPSLPNLSQKIAESLDVARQRQAALVRAMPQRYGQSSQDESTSLFGDGTEKEVYGDSSDSPAFASTTESTNLSSPSLATPHLLGGASPDITESGQTGTQGQARQGQAGTQRTGLPVGSSAANSGAASSGTQQLGGGIGSIAGTQQFAGGYGNTEALQVASAAAGNSGVFPDGKGTYPASPRTPPGQPTYPSFRESTNSEVTMLSGDMTMGSSFESGGSAGYGFAPPQGSAMSPSNPNQGSAVSPSNRQGGGREIGQSGATSGTAGNFQASSMGGTTAFPSVGSIDPSGSSFQQESATGSQSGSVPALNMNSSTDAGETTRPVAASRGANWAWDRAKREQTSVVRAIRLQCYLDRWVLLAEKGTNEKPETIELVGRPIERAGRLAIAIRRRVESWGVALSGGHWSPVLHVDVAADADWRYQQLCHLMEGSGIEVLRKETIQPN